MLAIEPIVKILLLLMVLDIISGLAKACALRQLSSSISFRGMSQKVLVLIVVATAKLLENFAGGVALANVVAAFYCVTEAISIIENAATIGVPIPNALKDLLLKLKK